MVKFVKSLNVVNVPMHDPKTFRYTGAYIKLVDTEDFSGIMETTFEIQEHVVPIQHLSQTWALPKRRGPDDTITYDYFIAVSEEVEELLQLPFKDQCSQIKDLEHQLDHKKARLWQIKNASLWQRLKYLFTKELPCITS